MVTMEREALPWLGAVNQRWHSWLCANQPTRLVVGVSGGLDSMALLHWLLHSLQFPKEQLRVVHVNHQLHARAPEWAKLVSDQCRERGVDCAIETVVVDGKRAGPEGAARQARFSAFRHHLQPSDVLVLGHHQDDRAETFLLNLMRGAGVQGLSAMAAEDCHSDFSIIRPWIDCRRSQLLDYAQHHQLQWVDDPSNDSTDYDRNFLRHRVLPLLAERWPHAVPSIARSAQWMAEAAELDYARWQNASKHSTGDGGLDLSTWRCWPWPLQKSALRHWLRTKTGVAPGEGWMATFLDTVANARADGQPELNWHNGTVRRYRDVVYWVAKQNDAVEPMFEDFVSGVVWHPPFAPLEIPRQSQVGSLHLLLAAKVSNDSALLSQPFLVQRVTGSVPFKPIGARHTLTVKKYFQHSGIAPWRRPNALGVFALEGRGPLLALILADGSIVLAHDSPFVLEWFDEAHSGRS